MKKHPKCRCFSEVKIRLFFFYFFYCINLTSVHLAKCIEWTESAISSRERDDTDEEPVGVLHEVETREQGSADRHTDESVDGTSITFHKKDS